MATAHLTDPGLELLTRVLAERLKPELILLFGSRMRGDADEHSDYDVLIVVKADDDEQQARRAACEVVRQLPFSVDVIARNAAQYLERQRDPGFLDSLIARDGIVLFSTGTVPQDASSEQNAPKRVREGRAPRKSIAMWLQRAKSDMGVAELSIAAPQPFIDGACFHAHAAVEKWLKAVIVLHTDTFPPRTHNLSALLALVPLKIQENVVVRDGCALLMEVYPKSRYPDSESPTLRDAEDAVRVAREIWAVVGLTIGWA